MGVTESAVRAVLRERVVHRELGINVVDLGLVYRVQVNSDAISVDMTLTTPGSPLAGELLAKAEETLRESFPEYDIEISLVWEPPWSPECMSEEARRQFARFS